MRVILQVYHILYNIYSKLNFLFYLKKSERNDCNKMQHKCTILHHKRCILGDLISASV
jgi:hypothetical protein